MLKTQDILFHQFVFWHQILQLYQLNHEITQHTSFDSTTTNRQLEPQNQTLNLQSSRLHNGKIRLF